MKNTDKKTGGLKPQEVKESSITVELPEILDQVPYAYCNHARLSTNKWDLRIAFGEIGPTGKLEPRTGVILPHVTAKGLLRALNSMIQNVEQKLGNEITDPDKVHIIQSTGKPRAPKKAIKS